MKPRTFMVIAGEASGDLLAAELVAALRKELSTALPIASDDAQPLHTSLEPRFFGAGGPRMAKAGVELAFDLTAHSVVGLWEVIKEISRFRKLLRNLYRLALERQPDAIICVDFGAFNRQFAKLIRKQIRSRQDWFHDWRPKIIQYVSPQVWASREDRAYQIARDYDLLLSTFAFEKDWYARKVPKLHVEFVGNPLTDRYGALTPRSTGAADANTQSGTEPTKRILLLPGSRKGELRRHVPVLVETAKILSRHSSAQFCMVLTDERLAERAASLGTGDANIRIQVGGMAEALSDADLAITKSGTITLELACFAVPAVVFYKTSIFTYYVARQLVRVKYLAMPNLLAGEPVYPELIQDDATPENLAAAALDLLSNNARRERVREQLRNVAGVLGGPGASQRAARAVVQLLENAVS